MYPDNCEYDAKAYRCAVRRSCHTDSSALSLPYHRCLDHLAAPAGQVNPQTDCESQALQVLSEDHRFVVVDHDRALRSDHEKL